jgi:hypothetical protein
VTGRENADMAPESQNLAGQDIYLNDSLHLITEKFYPDSFLPVGGRKYLDDIAAYSESTADKIDIISFVLDIDKSPENGFTIVSLSYA